MSDKTNAPDDEFLLLGDAAAFVIQRSKLKSLAAVQDLLLEYTANGRIPYSWHQIRLGLSTSRGIPPQSWGTVDDTLGLHVVVDWEKATITSVRVAPDPDGPGFQVWELIRDFMPAEPITQMRLVRLSRNAIVAVLHELGLMSAAAMEAQQAPQAKVESRAEEPKEAAARVEESKEVESNVEKPKKAALRPVRPNTAADWILRLAPDRAWAHLSPRALHARAKRHIDKLNLKHEQEAKDQGHEPPPKIDCPDVSAFQKALSALRQRDEANKAK